MFTASQTFINKQNGCSRTYKAKLVVGSTEITEGILSLKYEGCVNDEDTLTLGSTVSNSVEIQIYNPAILLEGKEFTAYIGIDNEYIPLGIFTAQKPQKEDGLYTFTAYDRMFKTEKAYFSSLPATTTTVNALKEIGNKLGFTIATNLSAISIKKIEGLTYREAVSYIAQLHGGYATFNRKGQLEIRYFKEVSYTVTADRYFDDLVVQENNFIVNAISCATSEETTLTAGTGVASIGISNPYMTQSILNNIYNTLKGFTYRPASFSMLGDILLDVGDIVTMEDKDGNVYKIPIMSITHDFDGGVTTTIEAVGKTEEELDIDYKGPSTKNMERYFIELALINKAVANKVDAEYVETEFLKVNNTLSAVNGEFETLKGNVAEFNKVTIEKLEAVSGKINDLQVVDLTAIKADIKNLNVDVANIEHVLAGNITAENIQVGAITAGSGIIANGAIGDAQISSLSANKLRTGTIDTSIINVASTDGTINISGNQILINKGTNNRVVLGAYKVGTTTEYGLLVRSADGKTTLIDGKGVHNAGITDGAITNNKVSDNANIDGTKLNINSVVTQINNGTTKLQSTVVNVGNKTLEVYLAEQTQTVKGHTETLATHSSKISANEKAISLKVDSQTYTTDKADMTSKLSKATSDISVLQDKIALKVEKTDIITAINNLEIGGRNLLQKFIKAGRNSKKNDDLTVQIGTGVGDTYFYLKAHCDLISGEMYTLSCEASNVPSGCNWSFGIRIQSSTGQLYINKNGKCFVTFELDKTITKGSEFLIDDLNGRPSTASNIVLTNFKLEKGSKPSDYTPAPEDTIAEVDTKISTAKAEIKVTTDSISQSVSSLQTTVSQKADSSTVTALTTRTANLETGLGGITGRVSSVESTVKTVGDTASSALSKIDGLEIGGRNLAPLSNIQNYAGGNLSKNKYYTVDGTKIIAINQALSSSLIGYKIYTNDTFIYTYSGYTDLSKIDIYFRCYDFSDTIIQAQVYINTYVYNGKFTLTFDNIPNNTYYFNIGIGSTSVSDYYIDKLKLEKGNKATDWTPAPEDQEDFATDKANTALNSAKNYTDGKITTVNEKIAEINITTEGITQRVSSTESTISSHTSQLNTVDNRINTAKNSAISTASADATTKANNAQTNSNSYTDGQINTVNKTITNKVAEIKATTDGITSKVEKVEQIATGSQGKMLYTDPTFTKGMNGISIYNNSGNGTVVVSRVTKSSDCPTKSNYMLQITTSGTSSPHNGGFYFATNTRVNAIFITKIIAKLPTGTEITWHTNGYGSGGKQEWLTPTNGTGNWKEYICKVTCGTSGTFSSTNFFALKGGTIPVTWYLAYATVYDLTDSSNIELRMSSAEQKITDEAIVSTVTKSTTYKDALNGKVSTSSIISCINQTAEAIKINASKINLTGAVTISALATETVNKLNTAYNTANTANSTANSVNSTVTSNKANWDKGLTAYNWTNANGSKASSLYNMVTKWTSGAVSDTTQINGGWVKTNTLTADKIAVGDFTNYATVNELDTTTMLPSTFAYGGTKRHIVNGIYELQRYDYTKSRYLMICDYTIHSFKNGDRLRFNFEVYSPVAGTYAACIWFYDTNKNSPQGFATNFTTSAAKWESKSVEVTINSDISSKVYYLIGFDLQNTTNNVVVRKSTVRKMNAGDMIVDGSITASKIAANSITSDKIATGAITVLSNALTTINSSGVSIKNGALKILNKAGNTVLSGDSSGNLLLNKGTISIQESDSLTTPVFEIYGANTSRFGVRVFPNRFEVGDAENKLLKLELLTATGTFRGYSLGKLNTSFSMTQGFSFNGVNGGVDFRVNNVDLIELNGNKIQTTATNIDFQGHYQHRIIWQSTYNGNRVGFFGGGSDNDIHVGMYDWGNTSGQNAGGFIWSYKYGGSFYIDKYCKFTAGTNISSTKEIKCDIFREDNSYNALELIRNTDFYRYKLKSDVKDGYGNYENIGVIVEYKTPDIFKSRDKDGINLYTMCSTTMLALKNVDSRTTELEKKIFELEQEVLRLRNLLE